MQYEASLRQEALEDLLYQFDSFESASVTPIAEKRMRNLIDCCRKCKKHNLWYCFLYDILIHLPFLCFWKEIEDSDIVAEVLNIVYEFYDCPTKRIRFVDHIVHSYLKPNDKVLYRGGQFINNPLWITYVNYLLKHSSIKRLTFDGYRLSELMSDLRRLDLSHFQLLPILQHGGRMHIEVYSPSEGNANRTAFYMIYDLISSLKRLWNDRNFQLTYPLSDLPPLEQMLLMNFRALLRSVRNPYVTTFHVAREMLTRDVAPDIDELRHWYNALFPGMEFGHSKPASLKHICRCVIRDRLNENWQLPNGIWNLGLPHAVCNYINLLED